MNWWSCREADLLPIAQPKQSKKGKKKKLIQSASKDFNLRLWCSWYDSVGLGFRPGKRKSKGGDFEEADQGLKGEMGSNGEEKDQEREWIGIPREDELRKTQSKNE